MSTFTEPKIRFAFDDPHSTHTGVKPAVYAAIEARMENCLLQSWQMYW